MVEKNVPLKPRAVLIVSFHFPPTNSIAAVRIDKFAKYLGQFGWNIQVLTVHSVKSFPATLSQSIDESNVTRTNYSGIGFSLFHGLAGKQDNKEAGQISLWASFVYRLRRLTEPVYSLPLLRLCLMEPLGWYQPAINAGMEILRKHRVVAIFSSYGPAMSHLIASQLHKRTAIPWVAEYRDLWSQYHYNRKIQPLFYLEQKLEQRVMKHSKFLITVSEPLSDKLAKLLGREVITIHNGFDEEDYLSENVPLTAKFTLTYTGNILSGKQDPNPLFTAIAELAKEGLLSSDDFEVRFYGDTTLATIMAPMIKEYQLQYLVKIYDFVPFTESLRKQRESTALLLLMWTDVKEKGVYTGKIFEYLGAGRPILAIGPKDGIVGRLLTESGTGVIVSGTTEIKQILVQWLAEFKNTQKISSLFAPDSSIIRRYTRKEAARKLALTLDEAIRQK